MTENKNLGNRGESLAKEYLQRHGYKIVASNYRAGHLEIDLISRYRNQLVFIEVKTRLKTAASQDDTPLVKWQVKNLKRAILNYCLENHIRLDVARLDLIVILVDQQQQKAELKHYRDIF